jgi:hypothetical protein
LEGGGSGLLETRSCNLSGGADESRENPQPGQPVSRVGFEPSTFRIQVPIAITTSACPMNSTYLAYLKLHFGNVLSRAKVTIDGGLD